MDGWNTSFLLGWPVFRGHVCFRECMLIYLRIMSARSEFLKLQCPYPRHSRGVVSAQVGWEYIELEKRIQQWNVPTIMQPKLG